MRGGREGGSFVQRSKHVYAEQFRVNVGGQADAMAPVCLPRPLVVIGEVPGAIAPPFP